MQPQRVTPEALIAEGVEAKDLQTLTEELAAGVLDDLIEEPGRASVVAGCAPTRPAKVSASATTSEVAAKVRAVWAVLMRNRVATVEKVTGWGWLEGLWLDTALAVRLWARTPGLTAIAIATIGLGIGASTALVGQVKAVFWTPLPVSSPHRPALRRLDVAAAPIRLRAKRHGRSDR